MKPDPAEQIQRGGEALGWDWALLEAHYEDHYQKFRDDNGNLIFSNPIQYFYSAKQLIIDAFDESYYNSEILTHERTDGSWMVYDRDSNEFATLNKHGFIGTYFPPDRGVAYWEQEVQKDLENQRKKKR